MRRTYRYRAKINKQTEANCNQWLEICQALYNLALEQKISIYRQHGKSISCYDQQGQLPELKAAYPEFKFIGAQCLQDVLLRLDKAFQAFYKRLKVKQGKAGFPRFKSRHRYDSFTLTQAGWKLEGRYLHIRNVGRFKLFLSRPIEGNIKTVTIKRTPASKWFVAFSCDNVPVKRFPKTTAQVGIDVGIKNFLVDSEGIFVENPQYFRQSEKLLRLRQRRLCRRKKGSNRRNKARLLVAKTHEKTTNQRKDFLHKTANHYIEKFQTIYVEDLTIGNMVKNRHLAKSIADSSWGMFFDMLTYKAEEAGRTIIKVSPHGTSQICSGCGEKVPKSLNIRIHRCPFCGLILDRDHNAAINILRAGRALQGGVGLPTSVD